MAITNQERVGKAMEMLSAGLAPSSSASSRVSTKASSGRRGGAPLLRR